MSKFGIGDEAFAISILRSQLYSEPVKAIVQEYISNARDAHREAKRISKNIKVHLPTLNEPWFSVRDYGNGVSSDKFENIFVKYCVSSKRESENQDEDTPTGCFGIGAKSAWANHKEFIVTSITDRKTVYRCYFKDTEKIEADGFYEVIYDEETTEETGVEIRIDINDKNCLHDQWKNDIQLYESSFIKVTCFWSIRPELIGEKKKVQYPNNPAKISGSGWWIFGNGESVVSGPTAIVDGIPYPIDINQFKDKGLGSLLKKSVYISFDAKKIPVAPNREQLRYTRKCKELIIEKMESVLEDIKSGIEKELNKKDTFREAVCYFHSDIDNRSLIGDIVGGFRWQGMKIPTTKMTPEFNYRDDAVINEVKYIDGEIEIDRVNEIEYSVNKKVLINDSEKKPSKSRLKTFFLKNSGDTICYVVTFNSRDEELRFVKNYNITNYAWSKTSNIPKTTLRTSTKKDSGVKDSRIEVVKIEMDSNKIVSYKTVKVKLNELKNSVYFETVRNKIVIEKIPYYYSHDVVKQTISICKKYDIYGVPTRFLSKCKNITDGHVILKKYFETYDFTDLAKYILYCDSGSFEYCDKLNHKVFSSFRDSNLIMSYLSLSDKLKSIKGLKEKHSSFSHIIGENKLSNILNIKKKELVNENHNEIINVYMEIQKRYPLLKYLNVGYYSSPPISQIQQYIKMCDKFYNEKNNQ